jgi:hypothetical protein
MKINTKYLEKVIKEEAAALLAEKSIAQGEWEKDVLECAKGGKCRISDDVVGPNGSTFGIDVIYSQWRASDESDAANMMRRQGSRQGDSGPTGQLARAAAHLIGIIEKYRRSRAPAAYAQSGYDINMVPGWGYHSEFDLSSHPAGKDATIKKLIATIQKLEAAAGKTAEKPAEPNPETQPALGQDVAVNEGAVPGEISAEDLTAAITLAIDEVFQEHRPNREAAAEAYANIIESIDAIFRESYAASARASKMMGAEAGFEDLDV